MQTNNLGIEQLLVITNPASTRYNQVEREVINVLDNRNRSDWADRYEFFETMPPSFGSLSNTERIKDLLVPNQAVIIAAGDGVVNDVINATDQAEDEVRTTTHHIVLPFGSGNDTARSLNGGKGRADFRALLNHGVKRELDLIDILVGEQKRAAVSYVALGWTALGSEAINQQDKREQKKRSKVPDKILDAITLANLIKELHFRPSFKYSEDAQAVREAGEMLFSNLPIMAGGVIVVEKSRPGHVVCIEIDPDEFVSDVAKRLATQRFTRGMKGSHITDRTVTVEPGTVIHFDGEARRLAERTKVTVSVKSKRIKALVKSA